MTTPKLSGLHHVTFPVPNLDTATSWFEAIFGAKYLPELDHYDEHGVHFGVVLQLPGIQPFILLRRADELPDLSEVVLSVADKAELKRWATHFDGHGIAHSEVRLGRAGYVMTCTMADGPALALCAG